MGNLGRWPVRAAVALCSAGATWLCVTAVRGGWDAANPIASVLGGAAGIAALVVSLGVGPTTGATAGEPPPPPEPVVPDWVVDRAEVEQVVAAVCARAGTRGLFGIGHRGEGTAVGIITGLHGAGGFGKTTLARVVCAHPQVRRRFRGRVYVVTIGRNVRGRAAIAAKVAEATRFITGDTLEAGQDPGRAGDHLGRLLARRPRTLLVIDDVWEAEQLEPFLRGAREQCVRLVTTRKPAVLPPDAARVVVDRMSPAQACAVLTHGLRPALPSPLTTALVKATGRWALLLRMVNQLIAVQAATGAAPSAAAQAILDRLHALGPAGADPDQPLELDDPDRRNTAVRASIQAATDLLPADGLRRFAELGIFSEDESVPLPLVALLWQATGALNEAATRQLCMRMADLSLLTLDPTVPGGVLALHDVVRDYLRAELATDLTTVNAALINAVAGTLRSDTGTGAETGVPWWQTSEGYIQDHLIEHLLDAGHTTEAERVASDLRWVRARLHQRGATGPWNDLDRIPTPTARALASDLARAAHLLSPTEPSHALDAVLHSRIAALAHWHDRTERPTHPILANRWPPPDLPDPTLLRTLTSGSGEVRALAFSPDSAHLAAADDDGAVRIWAAATGAALRSLSLSGVRTVAFSPDGTLLATAGEDGTVRLCDSDTGRPDRSLTGHTGGVRAVAFSPDGTLLATAGEDGTVRLWHPGTGRPVRSLTGHTESLRAIAFSPDGAQLATAGEHGAVRLWDSATGTGLRTLTGASGSVQAVAFSPDGALLATAGYDRVVRLWDPATGTGLRTLTGHGSYVNAVAFSPDGTLLVTAGYDRTIRVWDPVTGILRRTLTGHDDYVNAVAFSPDGKLLATAGYDRVVRLRDPSASARTRAATGVRSVAVATGRWLATADDDGTVQIRDTESGAALRPITNYIRGTRTVRFSPDGSRLATVGEDGNARIWDPTSGMPSSDFTDDIRGVRTVAFSPDGHQLAIAGEFGRVVRIWIPSTGTVLCSFAGAPDEVRAMTFSPDGHQLALAGADGTVGFWDAADGTVLRTLTDTSFDIREVAFSSDIAHIAIARGDGSIQILDAATGAAQRTITGHIGPVNDVAFSGPRLASVGDDGTARIWDPATGTSVTLMRTDSHLRCCRWSPDGRVLYAGGREGLFAYDFHPGAITRVDGGRNVTR